MKGGMIEWVELLPDLNQAQNQSASGRVPQMKQVEAADKMPPNLAIATLREG